MKFKNKNKESSLAKRLNMIRKNSMNIYNTNFLYGLYLQYYFKKYDWNKILSNEKIIFVKEEKIKNNLKLNIFKIDNSRKIYLLIKEDKDVGYLSCINNYLEDIFLNPNYIGKKYSKYLLKTFIEEKKDILI